jgi:glutamyl/glutaminyl-tRNA synthetase
MRDPLFFVCLCMPFAISPNMGNMTTSLPNGLCTRYPSSSCTVRIEDTNVALWIEGAEVAILYSLR